MKRNLLSFLAVVVLSSIALATPGDRAVTAAWLIGRDLAIEAKTDITLCNAVEVILTDAIKKSGAKLKIVATMPYESRWLAYSTRLLADAAVSDDDWIDDWQDWLDGYRRTVRVGATEFVTVFIYDGTYGPETGSYVCFYAGHLT